MFHKIIQKIKVARFLLRDGVMNQNVCTAYKMLT